jgi:phosphate transport system protein
MVKDSHLQHISHQFNSEMGQLKDDLLQMGGLVEQQVKDAITALTEGDSALAETVRSQDKTVDRMETRIDDESTQLIAKRQPAAGDLRLVMSVVKMVSDLERIGDEAKKIAHLAVALIEEGAAPRSYVEVRHIAHHVGIMLRQALDAFARLDTDQALAILKEDKLVDEEYKTATRSLIALMMEDPRTISRCMSTMWILRSLERVGDHACNLAEQVIFMAKGKDIRHRSLEEAERAIGR